jgi:nucleoside-diphosphate-sugar epimerase
MRVLITGATGLLGGHLIKELQQRGEDIRALVLPIENADKLEKQGVEVVRGDITDASTLEPAVKDVELVFHLAGMMGVWRPLADYRLVNVTGSENLYKTAQKAGVRRYVHTSSHTVYGLGYGRFLTEKDALRPDPDPYSLTKAEGDRMMRRLMLNSKVETVILRPGTFFGPGDRLHFGRMAQKMKDGKGVIIGRGDNALPFCYVTDVVQVYYGSIVAEKVVARVTRTKPIVTQLGAMMFGSDNRHSIEKARRELGYAPKVELRTGIIQAAEWFNAGGMDEVAITQASQNAPLAVTAS